MVAVASAVGYCSSGLQLRLLVMTAVTLTVYYGKRVFRCFLWQPGLLAVDCGSSTVVCFAFVAVGNGSSTFCHLLLQRWLLGCVYCGGGGFSYLLLQQRLWQQWLWLLATAVAALAVGIVVVACGYSCLLWQLRLWWLPIVEAPLDVCYYSSGISCLLEMGRAKENYSFFLFKGQKLCCKKVI